VQRDITESHKTLGAYKTISGDETDHIQYLRKKSDDMIDLLGSGQLNRRQAKIAYNCNYIPSMAYSTPAMCTSETSMYRVTMKATARFLQLLGIEKNFPRAAVFGRKKFGGIGLKQLYTESICSKIECLLCNINDNNKLGKIMKRVINWTQKLCGTEQPILESTVPITWIKNNWFITIRDFLTKCNATIKIKHAWTPKLLREHDYVIMEKMLNLKLTQRDLTTANNWRLYFQVSTLAQITNYAGDKILPQYFERTKIHHYTSTATDKWPRQERPDIDTFRIWKKVLIALTGCSTTGGITNLGSWLHDYSKNIRVTTVMNRTHDKLAIWCPVLLQWKHLDNMTVNYTFKKFRKTIFEYDPTIDVTNYIPVDLAEDKDYYKISVRNIPELEQSPQRRQDFQIYNLQEFLLLNQVWDKSLICNTTWYHNINRGIHPNDIIQICCDGGLRNNIAGYGVIFSINNVMISKTLMRIHEEYGEFTSYRSEAFGLLGALTLYNKIQDYNMKITGSRQPIIVTIYCDNESLVDIVNSQSLKKFTRKFYYTADADVIKEIVIMMNVTRSLQDIWSLNPMYYRDSRKDVAKKIN
jgi:hypothetical protein